MNALAIQIVISIGTIFVSISGAAFISGTRWGRIEATLNDLEKDRVRTGDISNISERLARIEGMFTLRLKGSDSNE